MSELSPILAAIYQGKMDEARELVESGIEPTFAEACALGDGERVARMLANDPDAMHVRSGDGHTPLGLSIFFRHPDIARLLIERGADVNAASENVQRVAPVHAAAAVCDRETMRMLLERGADVNARQQVDYTPLHGAASRGDVEMAKLLIEHGADRDAKAGDGKSIADAARSHDQPAFAEWLESL